MKRFLAAFLAALLWAAPSLALTASQRTVVLNGVQSWSLPSSADLFFSLNAGSCAINRLPVSCSSQISVTRAQTVPSYAQWADGHLSAFAANTPRITDQGLLVEQASTNEALQSRDMTQAAWVKVTMTNAKTATGVDNVANSATLLTAAGANSTILQTLTITSQAETYSVYIERVTGTGNIQITENNGGTWTTATSAICTGPGGAASNLLTTAYVRCTVEATLANPIIGIRIVTNGDAVNVDFNQDEELAFATSPIPTTTIAVTRNADVITLSGAAPTAALNAKAARIVTNALNYGGATAQMVVWNTSGSYLYWNANTTQTRIFAGAGSPVAATVGSGGSAGLVKSAFGFDASGLSAIGNGGTKATNSQAWSGTGTVSLGADSGAINFINGYMLRATFSPVKGAFDNLTTGSNPQ